jgi:GntR family transcriptional regulator/MocR family aminotransferase
MTDALLMTLDRGSASSLSEQIRQTIEVAIQTGRLTAGARLPSWRDLASQLGVARGTVKAAYDRLSDAQLIVSAGAAGTHVSDHLPQRPTQDTLPPSEDPFAIVGFASPSATPRLFQPGVPAENLSSAKTWSRVMVRGARQAAARSLSYPDPRGEPLLRHALTGYLAIARSLVCREDQIFITNGFSGGLALIIRALALDGKKGWIENPGYPPARKALELCGVQPVPVPVDGQGLDVARAVSWAPDAAFAIVTPGQQAPLGMTMSLDRRHALLEWANEADAYIIEDDYLGELQLDGRAAPSMASIDRDGRVIHIGTFSKTISPALRLGFVVVPAHLVARFVRVVACLAPASALASQLAVASFLSDGHLLRHLRKARRLYTERRDLLRSWLSGPPFHVASPEAMKGGLSVLLPLPPGAPDRAIALQARESGLGPSPLSQWYSDASIQKSGLLLGVTNVTAEALEAKGEILWRLVSRYHRTRHTCLGA